MTLIIGGKSIIFGHLRRLVSPLSFVLWQTRSVLFRSCCIFENPCFRNILTIRPCSSIAYLRVYCRIGAKSMSQYIQYNARIWLLTRVFAIPSTGRTLSTADSEFERGHIRDRILELLQTLNQPQTDFCNSVD